MSLSSDSEWLPGQIRHNQRNNRQRTTGYENTDNHLDNETRLPLDLLEREQVVIMQPGTTELRLQEVEGDIDQDSGISCEDHLLKDTEYPRGPQKEKLRDVVVQVFIPFMIAGLGMMAAGLLLDTVQVGKKLG